MPDQADFFGRWKVIEGHGPDVGTEVRISERAIESELIWIRLVVEECRIDDEGRCRLHGDHCGELVHVTLVLDDEGRLELSWNDGVTFPAEITLSR